ncbi:Fatty acid metabolism regulator protein [Rubripirellula obstinata]|uniref:Fatty acid metabolism regulator protein n=1 Tax=Rubripirellula obstinata TaxID=406547 RepID=A0A5B1CEM4_9BACT|nr:TetR/AcrR family transcriptional regulator [Rubripirellula obstinata]KAA1258671.1 Fatty acid metabolism regulator protein [Rubripirellula obstinata]
MTEISAKQIEIQHRTRDILSAGYQLLAEDGLDGVKLERIAKLVGCTRGTLYNHFKNREEILVAMAQRAVARRLSLFHKAVDVATTSREKIASICFASMVYADEMPLAFAIEQAIRNESIWQRTSKSRQNLFRENEMACMKLAGSCIDQAIADRDLPLPAGLTAEQMIERVCFGLWSLSFGGLIIDRSSPSLEEIGIRDVRSTIHHNCNALLDSFGWQPMFDPLDYQAYLRRVGPVLKDHANQLSGNTDADTPPPKSRTAIRSEAGT